MTDSCNIIAPSEILVGSMAGLNGGSACILESGHEGEEHLFRNLEGVPIVWKQDVEKSQLQWCKVDEFEAEEMLSGSR